MNFLTTENPARPLAATKTFTTEYSEYTEKELPTNHSNEHELKNLPFEKICADSWEKTSPSCILRGNGLWNKTCIKNKKLTDSSTKITELKMAPKKHKKKK